MAYETTENNEIYDFYDTVIFNSGNSQVLQEDGMYDFTVGERKFSHYEPSASSSLPACNEVDYPLTIRSKAGATTITYHLYLCKSQMWKVAQFFQSIGLLTDLKDGDKVEWPWDAAVGRKGRCEVGHRESSNGKTYNQINTLLPFEAPEAGGFNE